MSVVSMSATKIKAGLLQLLPVVCGCKRYLNAAFFSFIVFYFAYHALNGERGLYAYFKQSRNLEISQSELARLTSERVELEQRVQSLNSGSLDLDLLDEEARRILGNANKNEVVVLVTPR